MLSHHLTDTEGKAHCTASQRSNILQGRQDAQVSPGLLSAGPGGEGARQGGLYLTTCLLWFPRLAGEASLGRGWAPFEANPSVKAPVEGHRQSVKSNFYAAVLKAGF